MAKCKECKQEFSKSFWSAETVCPGCRGQQTEEDTSFRRLLYESTPRCFVTPTLVGLNILVFVVMAISGVSLLEPKNIDLIAWGADYGPATVSGEWWRLLSSAFIHIGVIHIALNMWCLWSLGGLAERIYGNWTFLGLYLLSGLGGSIASIAWNPIIVSAGASGAVFGIAGSLVAFFWLGKVPVPAAVMKRNLSNVITFIAYNVIYGMKGGGIDNAAHVGGLVTGFALGALMVRPLPAPIRLPRIRDFLALAAGVIAIVAGGFFARQRMVQGPLKAEFAGAFYELGTIYDTGTLVPKNVKKAHHWYRLGADQGSAGAQLNLGVLYLGGEGVPKDEREAVKWFRMAAEQNLPTGLFDLGTMYEGGRGVPQNDREAARLYRLAAEQGLAVAQYNLAVMCAQGKGIPKDEIEAVKWLRSAAEQGNANGQYLLAAMLASGLGGRQDLVQSYMWLELAVKQGKEEAKKLQAIAASEMTPAQIREAESAATNWKPKGQTAARK